MLQKIRICVIILFLFKINYCFSDDPEDLIARTSQGQIRGRALVSDQGKTYYAYQDIPYAAPPVGKLRFKEPVPASNWTGILNTTENIHSCYLNGRDDERAPGVVETEDCLYLNVYTPVKPGTNSFLPVLFWIHGGGFYFGDGTYPVYGPQYLIDYDIVVVTINYRLGAFGFLTTEDGVIPGNLGLKDQNLALQWVRRNIGFFGGDSVEIVIAGESAGGASVGYHLISAKSTDSIRMFRGAILQSGTAICSFAMQKHARYYAFELGNTLDPKFTSDNSTALLELLQNASATDINNITIEVPDDMVKGLNDKQHVWLPVVENEDYPEAFVTRPMHEDFKNGKINQVPIMLGYNSEEEIVFIGDDDSDLRKLAENIDKDLSKMVNEGYNVTDADLPIVGGLLRQLYTKDSLQQNFSALVKYLTDAEFTTPIIQHAELQSSYTDVYLYQFSYKGAMGCTNTTIEGVDTVGHAEDLKYLWHIDRLDDGSIFSVGDKLTRRRLLRLWTNFVKYLNPTFGTDALLENVKWPKVQPNNITYLNINRTLEVKTNPRSYQQFKTIVDKYANPPLYTY